MYLAVMFVFLSTSSLLQMYPAEAISLKKGKLILSGEPGQPTHGPVIASVDPMNISNISSLQL
jgi:hypothetical protein